MPFDTGTHQSHQLTGAIVGAVAGDNIDLRSQPFVTGDKLVWDQPTGTLLLETSNNSVLAKLTLAGAYTQSSFTAADDQHNGTVIHVVSGGVGAPPRCRPQQSRATPWQSREPNCLWIRPPA